MSAMTVYQGNAVAMHRSSISLSAVGAEVVNVALYSGPPQQHSNLQHATMKAAILFYTVEGKWRRIALVRVCLCFRMGVCGKDAGPRAR